MKELNIDPLEDVDYSDQYKFEINPDSKSRNEYNVKAFYFENGIQADGKLISGYTEDTTELYSEQEVFDRFKLLFEFENSQASDQLRENAIEYEEAKRNHLKEQGYTDGIQIWGIGHKFPFKDPGHNFEFEGNDHSDDDYMGDEHE